MSCDRYTAAFSLLTILYDEIDTYKDNIDEYTKLKTNLIYTILLKLFTFNFNTNTKIYEQIYNILDKKEEILNKTSDIKLIEYRHDPKLIIDDILKQTIFIKD